MSYKFISMQKNINCITNMRRKNTNEKMQQVIHKHTQTYTYNNKNKNKK